MNLHEAINTYSVALHEIKECGYAVSLEDTEPNSDDYFWVASKNDKRISAFNPLSLLALVTVAEKYGTDWNRIVNKDLYGEIIECGVSSR
jgi:hypothetical protein